MKCLTGEYGGESAVNVSQRSQVDVGKNSSKV